jgi:hypothetical protein
VRFDDGETPFDCSSVAQVGRAVVAILSEGNVEKTANQYVYVRSGRFTQNQVLGILERESGQQWTVVPNEAEALRLQGVAIWDKVMKEHGGRLSDLSENEELQMSIHMIVGGLIMGKWAQFGDKAQRWMKELGLEEETLDAIVAKATREAVAASA